MQVTDSHDDYVTVVCTTCHARLHPRATLVGKKIICPDCGIHLVVPPPKVAEKQRYPTPEEIGEYQVGPAEKPMFVAPHFLAAQAVIHSQPVPTPPRWTFFSGIFEFPFYQSSLPHWIYLTLGLLAIGTCVSGLLNLAREGGAIAVIGAGFFVLPIFWLSIWSFSYGAACCLAIVEDTAACNDEVVHWPSGNWREWFWKLLYVAYLASLAGLASSAAGSAIHVATGRFWLPTCVVLVAVFPVVLLSSLEANSPWVPASRPIVRSFFTRSSCWFVFYLEVSLLAAPLLAVIVLAGPRSPFLTTLVASPLLSAYFFVYARLLGRLAWTISEQDALRSVAKSAERS